MGIIILIMMIFYQDYNEDHHDNHKGYDDDEPVQWRREQLQYNAATIYDTTIYVATE